MRELLIRGADPGDSYPIAALHRRLFDPAWDAASIAALMAPPTGLALVASLPSSASTPNPLYGFLLARAAAGEAEILSIATAPELQRRAVARRLLETAVPALASRGARRLFLEVASDNDPALALYRNAGFTEVGRRRAYYARRGGPAADALVMARDL